MTFTQDPTISQYHQAFQSLDVDEQLALFWFIYTEMGGAITPAAPGASTVSTEIGDRLYEQVQALSHEEQLQVQRDLIAKRDCQICREYGSLGDTTKLLFWYRLAQGMERAAIIPMPPGYQLSDSSQNLLNQIKGLDFSQQITLFRDIVSPMGTEPRPGAEI